MKIAIDLTPLYGRKTTGVERHGIQMYQALLQTRNDIFPIFRMENTIDNNVNAIIISFENRLVVENILLSKAIRKLSPDIALFPIFPPPIDLYCFRTLKVIAAIHDLTFLKFRESMSLGGRYYATPKFKIALRHADQLITISETVKKEIAQTTSVPVSNLKINVPSDYQNIQPYIDESVLSKWNLISYGYIVSVSTIEPRKNVKYLLKVFYAYVQETHSGLKLVMVGRNGWGDDKELTSLIDSLGDSIVFTNYVETNELINLYHFAKTFILLSVYEGFGLTPLEAVACGCNSIILSDIPVFRETMDNSAIYVPLNNEREAVRYLVDGIGVPLAKKIDIPFGALDIEVIKFIRNNEID